MASETDERFKISEDMIDRSAGPYAPTVAWLRPALRGLGKFLNRQRKNAGRFVSASHVTLIVLGFVASLAAIFSKPDQKAPFLWLDRDAWSDVNIVVPLIITALGSAFAFYDFRGRYARSAAAYMAITTIKSEMDYAVVMGSKSEHPTITKEMIEGWQQRINVAVHEYEEGWQNAMAGNQSSS